MAELPDKATHFIDWYLEVVERAGLTDKRYPVKGMNVWPTYGLRARRLFDEVLIREIESSHSEPVEFPLLIPQTEFQKEKDHIKGFDAEVYWVTKGGATELEVPLLLRPTSETAMYPIFALWVRSHSDLPLQVYQIVNTFRYETKTTRPFWRVREIHFFEEHTCQLDDSAADRRVKENLASFANVARTFALPYVALRRPEWDKFAGAYYSVAFDVPLGEARTLQIGSVHHYRENFSRPYGITYEAVDGAQKYVHQTTFGISERLVGTIVAIHGDQKGAVFPSSIAPFQVVIVPIAKGGASGADASDRLAERLRAAGVRVKVDHGPERPGAKYYRWEERGVPLRLEVGPREAESGGATAVDRLGLKTSLPNDGFESATKAALASFDARLKERADASFRQAFSVARTKEELAGSTTVRWFSWCGEEECGHAVEQAIEGAVLGTPEGWTPTELGAPGACLNCGRTPARWALAGRPI